MGKCEVLKGPLTGAGPGSGGGTSQTRVSVVATPETTVGQVAALLGVGVDLTVWPAVSLPEPQAVPVCASGRADVSSVSRANRSERAPTTIERCV
jgi:hypothetical protein